MACGALAGHAVTIAAERHWPLDVIGVDALLHNRPERIAGAVEAEVVRLRAAGYARVVVGYADCGTYGAVDAVCDRQGVERLAGLHCYDLFAGPTELERTLAEEPGTYLFTDFLVRSFARTVVTELGLDRYPELREDYFGHYRRVVWLAQEPTPRLRAVATEAAATIGLPLEVVVTGTGRLEQALAALVAELDEGARLAR